VGHLDKSAELSILGASQENGPCIEARSMWQTKPRTFLINHRPPPTVTFRFPSVCPPLVALGEDSSEMRSGVGALMFYRYERCAAKRTVYLDHLQIWIRPVLRIDAYLVQQKSHTARSTDEKRGLSGFPFEDLMRLQGGSIARVALLFHILTKGPPYPVPTHA